MGAAMRQIETLKANAERLAREKAAREERELKNHVARNAAEERREARETAKEESTADMVAEALDIEEPAVERHGRTGSRTPCPPDHRIHPAV